MEYKGYEIEITESEVRALKNDEVVFKAPTQKEVEDKIDESE